MKTFKATFTNHIKTLLKLAFSLGALFFIFQQLEIDSMVQQIQKINPFILILALIIGLLGQVLAGKRLLFYCRSKGMVIRSYSAVVLYFIGLFFNMILPGGIGGDGYVTYTLKRLYGLPLKRGIRLVLSARANGLMALITLAIGVSFVSTFPHYFTNSYLLLGILLLLVILVYALAAKYLLNEAYKTQFMAYFYSIGVQGSASLIMYLLLVNMQIDPYLALDYLALLLFSSILVILPISIGGLGLRELGFLYGSQLIGLDAEVGVAVSLIFYTMHVLLSLIGLWLFSKNALGQKI